ncbi:MAG: hypothetical protein V7L23_14570 [Nostoc sp.]|uniref:hypothetical protein n=1 Tax=Nostoc sp. TaxID=1180 RepID=UPI002FF1F7CC
MKGLFILGFSLITLAVNQLSALAQIRQPTNAELRRLRQELQQLINSTKKNRAIHIQDGRNQAEKQARESFVHAWSKVEPVQLMHRINLQISLKFLLMVLA